MMPVWAVMIKDDYGHRWIDSLWVKRYSWQNGAEERINVLKRVFESMNAAHDPYLVELILEDGALADGSVASTEPPSPAAAQPTEGAPAEQP